MSIVSALAHSGNVTITIGPESREDFRVEADANQIIRVFTNLVKNAIRASASGSSIDITTARKGRGVLVSISDQGLGMTSTQLRMAFDPGFSTKDGGQGGLGLAISYLMIEAHGGNLELRANKHGRGISALVWLPEACEHDPLDAIAFENIAGHSVILAMPQAEASERLATALQVAGCQQVAEVYTRDELEALIRDDPSWQIVFVAPDFPLGELSALLPTSLDIRFLKDSYRQIQTNTTRHSDQPTD